jgi:hypothetical protein
MNKGLDDIFNIENGSSGKITLSTFDMDSDDFSNTTIVEKVEHALSKVTCISQHDADMDAISKEALESYKALNQLGSNVSDRDAGKIYEVAATMLKIAMDAKDSKSNRKLKTLELQMKLMKHNQEAGTDQPKGNQFDRNELLRVIRSDQN